MEYTWINGEVLPLQDAKISVEDRGFQFADGVYEVIRLYNGRAFTLREHLDRLGRSCEGVKLGGAFDREELSEAIEAFVKEHGPAEGMVYLQVTRGSSPRNHRWVKDWKSTVLFYSRSLPAAPAPGQGEGVKLISVEDERWKRCWIKSIALLPNILAKNEAVDAKADEAVFVENGIVSECATSNLFAVIGGKLVTHPVGSKVLPGITRQLLVELAEEIGAEFVERPLRESEAKGAQEVFITSTTRELGWVSLWDGQKISDGQCGAVTKRLHEAYVGRVKSETGAAMVGI